MSPTPSEEDLKTPLSQKQKQQQFQHQNSSQCMMVVSDSPLDSTPQRPRSSTLGALTGEKIRCEIRNRRTSQQVNENNTLLSPAPTPSPSRFSSSSRNYNAGLDSGLGSTPQASQKHSPMMNM